jgi:hypothetical protein
MRETGGEDKEETIREGDAQVENLCYGEEVAAGW